MLFAVGELDGREMATMVFTLGQLGLSKAALPDETAAQLLDRVGAISSNFSSQAFANTLHGLARIGFEWSDIPQSVAEVFLKCGTALTPSMRHDELCSLFQSMALMKVRA